MYFYKIPKIILLVFARRTCAYFILFRSCFIFNTMAMQIMLCIKMFYFDRNILSNYISITSIFKTRKKFLRSYSELLRNLFIFWFIKSFSIINRITIFTTTHMLFFRRIIFTIKVWSFWMHNECISIIFIVRIYDWRFFVYNTLLTFIIFIF